MQIHRGVFSLNALAPCIKPPKISGVGILTSCAHQAAGTGPAPRISTGAAVQHEGLLFFYRILALRFPCCREPSQGIALLVRDI